MPAVVGQLRLGGARGWSTPPLPHGPPQKRMLSNLLTGTMLLRAGLPDYLPLLGRLLLARLELDLGLLRALAQLLHRGLGTGRMSLASPIPPENAWW